MIVSLESTHHLKCIYFFLNAISSLRNKHLRYNRNRTLKHKFNLIVKGLLLWGMFYTNNGQQKCFNCFNINYTLFHIWNQHEKVELSGFRWPTLSTHKWFGFSRLVWKWFGFSGLAWKWFGFSELATININHYYY